MVLQKGRKEVNDLDIKRNKIQNVAKLGAAGVVCFLVAPFILIVIKGLLGLIVAATIGVAAIQLAPLVAVKFANWRLKQYKAEAAKNPIETLQNDYNKRAQALNSFRDRIAETITAISNFSDMVDEYRKKHPDLVPKYQEQLDKMKQVLALRKQKYKTANTDLKDYWDKISMASDEWNMAQATLKANKDIGAMDGEEFMQKIMADTAIDSVKNALNQSFSELDLALTDEEAQKQVEAAPVVVDTRQIPAKSSAGDPMDLDIPTFEAVPVSVGRRAAR
jgi:hypothetical protein